MPEVPSLPCVPSHPECYMIEAIYRVTAWIVWIRGFPGPGWLVVDILLVLAAVLLTWLWCRKRFRRP